MAGWGDGVRLVALVLLLLPLAVAQNDPGHDGLYVVKSGDSNVSGSINLTGSTTASEIRYARLLYGDLLDIRANGSIQSVTSRPAIQAGTNTLYLDGNGNLNLNTIGGTTSVVQIGDRVTQLITLNVSGTIRQQGITVCLSNGTNCPGNLPSANTTGAGTTGYLARWTSSSNLGTSALYDDGTNIGIGTTSAYSKLQVAGSINATAYYGAGTGLTGTATSLSIGGNAATATTATDVSCTECIDAMEIDDIFLRNDGDTATGSYTFGTSTLHIANTIDRVGIGTTTPTTTLHVIGNVTLTGGTETTNLNQTGKSFTFAAGTGSSTTIDANRGRAGGNVTIRAGGGGGATAAAGGNGGNIFLTGGNGGGLSSAGGSIYLTPGTGESSSGAIVASGFVNLSSTVYVSPGSVGIATLNPAATLDVSGNLSVSGSTNSTIDGSTLAIDATSDRIGIGTTTPRTKLDVTNGYATLSNAYAYQVRDMTGVERSILSMASGISLADFGNNTVLGNPTTNGNLTFFTGGTTPGTHERMIISSAGDVNIASISGDGTGKVVCIKSDGNLGTCTSSVSGSGTCTCT